MSNAKKDGVVVAIVGATGAVGEVLLGILADRNFPVKRLVPLASGRSAGSKIEFQGREGRGAGGQARGLRGRRPGVLRRDRLAVEGSRARGGEARRDRDRQVEHLAHERRGAARRARDQPAGPRRPQGHHLVPELHDHRRGDGARADPPGGRPEARRDHHAAGRVGHRQARHRRARAAGGRDLARRGPDPRRLQGADRVQRGAALRELPRRRLLDRRGEAPSRDPQDPGRDPQRWRRRREHDLRARAGAGRPLGHDARRDREGRVDRGGSGRARGLPGRPR